MELSSFIQPLLKIAREAGDAILEIYKNEDDFGVEAKSDNSPLTRADKASNEVICVGLENLDPQFPIISEENKAIEYETRKNFEYCWLVDPLDGTKEFIKRNGEFTVNIALLHKNKVVMGVVYAPVLDEMYWAVKGEGAFLDQGGKKLRLEAANFTLEDEGLNLVCSRSHLNEETEKFVSKFKNPGMVSKGSSLKFLMLAKGEAHIYPRVAPTMEWDTGAAQIVLEEAGGKILHYDTGEPLVYNKENLLNPYFIAYGNVNG
ncbi:MAG: 3'(2'),5'-bisphosphate nucleotidase CysQ [Saprospiraceae bacterium]